MTDGQPSVRVDMLGVQVDAQRFDTAIARLIAWAGEPSSRYISTCPVYTLMVCQQNATVRAAVNGAAMVTADGMPITWVQRWWGHPEAERVYGPDIMLAVCARTAGSGLKHFFLGGSPGVAEKLTQVLPGWFPGLEIVGTFASAQKDELETALDPVVLGLLRDARPDFIWVGLGSPKQDLWMALYQPVLEHGVLVGVGAAFDFLSGAKRQAPRWMRDHGLEWLFRLLQEPRRLARRYLIYNPLFVWRILQQYFARR